MSIVTFVNNWHEDTFTTGKYVDVLVKINTPFNVLSRTHGSVTDVYVQDMQSRKTINLGALLTSQ